MEETRYGKLGRLDALIINQIIGLLYSDETSKIKYKKSFLNEFNDYLDRGKKKGEPVNEGCVWELEDLANIDLKSPQELARWLKEHQHTKYQKQNVNRERKSFLENF